MGETKDKFVTCTINRGNKNAEIKTLPYNEAMAELQSADFFKTICTDDKPNLIKGVCTNEECESHFYKWDKSHNAYTCLTKNGSCDDTQFLYEDKGSGLKICQDD